MACGCAHMGHWHTNHNPTQFTHNPRELPPPPPPLFPARGARYIMYIIIRSPGLGLCTRKKELSRRPELSLLSGGLGCLPLSLACLFVVVVDASSGLIDTRSPTGQLSTALLRVAAHARVCLNHTREHSTLRVVDVQDD